VLFLGAILLVALGNREVLLRLFLGYGHDRGELRLQALGNLERLTHAADKGDFELGLMHADEIDIPLLDRFESMNLRFLRAYCAVQYAMGKVPPAARQARLEEAVRDLKTVLEEAPNHAEAIYLLACAEGFLNRYADALAGFQRAESMLEKSDLPIAQNKSVCYLRMAEERLIKGDADESSRLLDHVTRLKVMADRIPSTLVKARLLSVRQRLQTGKLSEALQGIEVVRQLEGFDPELRRSVELVCDAFQALVSIRQGDDEEVVRRIDAFVLSHFPTELPAADEDVADEFLEAPVAGVDLRVDARVFSAVRLLKATVLARVVAKGGKPPTAAQVDEIIRTLLTALQFELRQRELLAALGGVYYWFVPDKRDRAVTWLESAVALGTTSRVARRILEHHRRLETENREALEWFRTATGRFLHDPTVSNHVRQALIEELGRFRGFQSMLLELDKQTELESQEPTVRLLRERAEYMQQVVADFAGRKAVAIQAEFNELRHEYARLIAALEAATGRMAEIERRFVQEVGKSVLS
jgi:tetratricopeptide (TPR) repeat protein